MIAAIPVARLFRTREEGGDRVAFVELFFDLVFVFAVTQLSHHVIEHLTPLGVLEGVVMLVAVWWLWIYTTWVTNWMNPQKGPVRWMLITMMLGGLVLSTAIPEAFGDRAAQFAIAYLVMQVGRTVFVAISYAVCDDRTNAMNLVRIALWFVLSAPFWIAGALLGGEAQLPLWAAALVVELLGPAFRYWMPRLGVSPPETWQVAGGHMAERAGLFMIIALGESIIITGTLFSRSELTTPSVLAFLAAFVSTILFWLLYFSHGAEHGARFIQASRNTGIIARLTYTYLHMVLVAGIVLVAVGDELVLAHPDDPIDGTTLVIVLAAPALIPARQPAVQALDRAAVAALAPPRHGRADRDVPAGAAHPRSHRPRGHLDRERGARARRPHRRARVAARGGGGLGRGGGARPGGARPARRRGAGGGLSRPIG